MSLVSLTVVRLDKSNATRNTNDGQYAICINARSLVDASGTIEVCDMEVWPDEAAASARVSELKKVAQLTAGGAAPPADHEAPDGTVSGRALPLFSAVKRSELHHFTSLWKGFTRPEPLTDLLIGTKFNMAMPLNGPELHFRRRFFSSGGRTGEACKLAD